MHNLPNVKRFVLTLAVIAAILLPVGPPVRASEEAVWKEVGELGKELAKKDLDEMMDQWKNALEAGEKLKDLSSDDNQYEPDYDPGGMPELPALCKGSAQCEKCFVEPNEQLNNLRFRFEKLRKINRVTKNMLRDAIEFGNAASEAAGGLVPFAWAQEKEKVRESETNFNASYDAKYAELMATLKATLQAIAACEEKVFGEQGWYERYGFMYYQFMAATYRRPD